MTVSTPEERRTRLPGCGCPACRDHGPDAGEAGDNDALQEPTRNNTRWQGRSYDRGMAAGDATAVLVQTAEATAHLPAESILVAGRVES
jgi:hypothetical protein